MNKIHAHQIAIARKNKTHEQALGLRIWVEEKSFSPRKGIFGILCEKPSMHGGPSQLVAFQYAPKHATKAEAEESAYAYLSYAKDQLPSGVEVSK